MNLAQIYKYNYVPLFQHAFRLTQCEDRAKDLVQDVFFQCLVKEVDFSTIENAKAYLLTMLRNRFMDDCRKQHREHIGLAEYERHYRQLWPPTGDPVLEKEYDKLIQIAVKQLPDRQREVFLMRTELGKKRKTVATELDLSEFTVKEHAARATRSVKRFIDQQLSYGS